MSKFSDIIEGASTLEVNDSELSNLAEAIENNLDQAEIILAAQDVMAKLQDMAEDLAKITAHDVFPLVDKMKSAFGSKEAARFEDLAQTNIDAATDAVRSAKDVINEFLLQLEGKLPMNDMAAFDDEEETELDADLEGEEDNTEMDLDSVIADFEDEETDAASQPNVKEPLGRAKKESVEVMNKPLKENKMVVAGRVLIEREGLDSLIDWVLNEAVAAMPAAKFKDFASKVASHAAKDPEALAGWIGKKKYGAATIAQLAEPTVTANTSLSIVESELNENAENLEERRYDDEDEEDDIRDGKRAKKGLFVSRNKARKAKRGSQDSVNERRHYNNDEDDDFLDDKRRKKERDLARKRARNAKGSTLEEGSSLRLISTLSNGNRSAKIYYNRDWEEYVVKHYEDGVYNEEADYFDADKEGAVGTAEHWVNGAKTNEDEILEASKSSDFDDHYEPRDGKRARKGKDLERRALRRIKSLSQEEELIEDDNSVEQDDPNGGWSGKVEAYGVYGLKSKPWRKTFKNGAAFLAWLDKNGDNYEVHGTRDNVEESQEPEKVEVVEADRLARGVAKMIEANVIAFGKGRASHVVKEFASKSGSLFEGSGQDSHTEIVKAFESIYGVSPVEYSIRLSKKLGENLSINDKKNAAGALSKIASKMGADRNAVNKPISTALQGLNSQERNATQKIINQMKKDGQSPRKVGDLVSGAEGIVSENANDGKSKSFGDATKKLETSRQKAIEKAKKWIKDGHGTAKDAIKQFDLYDNDIKYLK